MNNPLWEFAVTKYAQEAVARACLLAQDEAGSDVNLLLYAAWLAEQGCELCTQHLAALEAKLSPWRSRVITPLRQLRRDWKGMEDAEQLREEVKSLELLAEQEEVGRLWQAHELAATQPAKVNALGLNLMRVLALTCVDSTQCQSLRDVLEAALADGALDSQG